MKTPEGGGVHVGPFSHGHERERSALRTEFSAFVVSAAPPSSPRSGPQNLAIPHSWLCHGDNGETWPRSPKCVSRLPICLSVASGRLRHRQRQRARWINHEQRLRRLCNQRRARAYCVQSRTYLLSRTPYRREYKSEWEALIRHIVWLYTNEIAS